MGIIFDYVSFLFFFYVSTHKEFSNVLVSYPVSFLISIEYFSLHNIMQVKLYFHGTLNWEASINDVNSFLKI